MNKQYISVLTIAGSDSGGGAGIQADIKTISALGCYATSVITAVTSQNTLGVSDIHPIPIAHIASQLKAVMTDIPPRAIKIGMVDRPEVAQVIAACLDRYPDIPVVFDPVMVATSGHRLVLDETMTSLRELLFPRATLLTPNLDEASLLINRELVKKEEMLQAGIDIFNQGAKAVLVKGGHLKGEQATDLLLWGHDHYRLFELPYIQTLNGHGTGCTLSSAIAVGLAKGMSLEQAVQRARDYIWQAIFAGKDVRTGKGSGPLNHFFQPLNMLYHDLDS
jgi:hydroxymethylpyrimidine/phosphomethylpyrimidine kinase